jgi:hypothetical protein
MRSHIKQRRDMTLKAYMLDHSFSRLVLDQVR